MNRIGIAGTTILLALLFVATAAEAQFQAWEGSSIVDDPEWRKSFLGSYGFLSGAEPSVAPQELELLREVIDLMKVNPRAAAAMLEQQKSAESSAALDFVLANLQFQNGNLGPAAASYERALEKFPDFRRAHKNLGLLKVQGADFDGGRKHLSRAIELGDRDGRTYGLLGYCYVNQDRYLTAEIAYRNAILAEPETRDWQLGLARSLLALEKYDEAVGLFDSLIADDPNDSASWMLQANAYLGLEQPMAAAVNLEAVRMMGRADTSSLVLLGDIYMNEGMAEQATSAYLEVIRRDDRATQYRSAYRAAELLVRSGSFDQAGEVLASIDERYGKKLDEDDQLEVLTLRAKVARATGREKEAAKLLESIVQRDGTRGDALLELAAYYQSRDDEARARLFIERAQNLKAFEYDALLAHAQLDVGERDYAAAAKNLRAALEIRNEPRVEVFLARVEEAIRR